MPTQREREMKFLNLTGSIFAAIALVTVVGVSTASAESTLCKVTEDPCATGNMYPVGTEVHAVLETGTHLTITPLGGLFEITCKNSTIKGVTQTTTTPGIELETFSIGGCDAEEAVTLDPGQLQVHWDTEHNGNVTTSGFSLRVKTGGLSCTFGSEAKAGVTLKGGNPATLEVTKTMPKLAGGFLCPATAILHAKYNVTTPTPLYVASGL